MGLAVHLGYIVARGLKKEKEKEKERDRDRYAPVGVNVRDGIVGVPFVHTHRPSLLLPLTDISHNISTRSPSPARSPPPYFPLSLSASFTSSTCVDTLYELH